MLNKLKEKLGKAGFIAWFFLFYSIYGLFAVNFYGIPLDEFTQRVIGIENNRYISGEESREELSKHSFFGPVFESITVFAENLYPYASLRVKVLVRHYLLFCIFILSIYCVKKIAEIVFNKEKIPILFVLFFYALHPRIFADAHYNSKDLLLMCMMVFSVHFFLKWYAASNPKLSTLIWAAVLLGIGTSVRMHAALLVPIYLVFLIQKKQITLKTIGFPILAFLLSFYICFPYYWKHPIDSFVHQFTYLTQNPWPWDILTDGEYIKPKEIPWNYLPKWIFATTPLIISCLFLLGLILIIKYFKNNYYQFFFLLLAIPMLVVWTMKPTMYDGWRHFTFLYFPMVFICGFGASLLVKIKINFAVYPIILLLYFGANHLAYIKKEYAYFNENLSINKKPGSYVQDYWNVSSRECVSKIYSELKEEKIKLYSFTEAADYGTTLLPEKKKERILIKKHRDSADYELELKRSRFFPATDGEVLWNYATPADTLARFVRLRKRVSSE